VELGKGVAQGILSLANAANSHRGSGKCTSAAILANQMQRNPNPLYTPALLSLPPSHPSIPSSTSFCSPNAPAAVVRKVRKLRNAPSSIRSQAATLTAQRLATLQQQGMSAAQAQSATFRNNDRSVTNTIISKTPSHRDSNQAKIIGNHSQNPHLQTQHSDHPQPSARTATHIALPCTHPKQPHHGSPQTTNMADGH